MPPVANPPRIAVLLATHNGERYLDEQLSTILSQEAVDITLLVSDDNSTDGTRAKLKDAAARDPRIRVLTPGIFGEPAPNFFRLLTELDLDEIDYVGFADQDDRWAPRKLASHARLLIEHGADGVSSNVTAFRPDGSRTLIRKDYPQRLADHLFETPGPGSSFLLTSRLARLVQHELRDPASPARLVFAHDWLIYAMARSAGLRWIIDPTPTVDYRQHDGNAVGANAGAAQALKRLRLSAAGWHRRQVELTVDACLRVASAEEAPRLAWFREVLSRKTLTESLRLARRASQLRRRPRDRFVLFGLLVTGLW
ncbi:glycosyl transferase [Pseudoclavibacter endophyticus]|nr:glycosyltransferase [Pseudoclavibacter endophyticus]GGA65404.1 glycosyl transferase [Pseudoclavibacter endophyticus]